MIRLAGQPVEYNYPGPDDAATRISRYLRLNSPLTWSMELGVGIGL
jgi:hypothetical protein